MRPFEPIFPDTGWRQSLTFSPAIRAGNLVFISGTTATDDNGQIVGRGDIAAQTRFIFEKLGRILKAAGGTLENLVETTDYVLSLDDYKQTAAVRRELLQGPPWPAATGVVVRRPRPPGCPDRNQGGGGALTLPVQRPAAAMRRQ